MSKCAFLHVCLCTMCAWCPLLFHVGTHDSPDWSYRWQSIGAGNETQILGESALDLCAIPPASI